MRVYQHSFRAFGPTQDLYEHITVQFLLNICQSCYTLVFLTYGFLFPSDISVRVVVLYQYCEEYVDLHCVAN